VPGRLEVFGKHTDYAGGRSLVAAVPRGITVRAARAADRKIVVCDVATGEQAEFGSDGTGSSAGWRRYPQTVIRRLARNFPDRPLAARIEIFSDLPQAAGISSSSALLIAIAEALIACSGIEESDAWRAAISTMEDRAVYFGSIENGTGFRTLAGDEGAGTHGGSEDHAAILMSRTGCLRQFSFSPLRLDRVIRMPEGWTFVVASTGVAAHKTGGAQDHYNRAAAAAAEIQASVGDLRKIPEVRKDALLPHLRARLDHFVAEDMRVRQAADAFEHGDTARIGELAAASQLDAEQLLGNQLPETIDMTRLAWKLGAAAASSFGAGWGGSVWALVPCADADAFLAGWLRAYVTRHPHLAPEGFVSPPSDGMRRL
jgi:galactokinase